MKIGFIGLGIMGKPMAKNLIKAGYHLNVFNRSQPAIDELVREGATAYKNPKEIAEASDVIMTMLPDSLDVEKVILDSNGVIEGIGKGNKIVVDMSSINPLVAKKVSKKLSDSHVPMLDAPVSGGEIGAIEGKLAFMVGGPEDAFNEVKDILLGMGSTITRVGEIGAGNTVKLINQVIVAINLLGISEALSFGKKAGVDPLMAFEAIKGGLAGSRVLETKINNIKECSFEPGFRINLHEKDLNNAIAMANEVNAELRITNQIIEMFQQLDGEDDHSALYKVYEKVR